MAFLRFIWQSVHANTIIAVTNEVDHLRLFDFLLKSLVHTLLNAYLGNSEGEKTSILIADPNWIKLNSRLV